MHFSNFTNIFNFSEPNQHAASMVAYPKLLLTALLLTVSTMAFSQESLMKELDTTLLRKLIDTAKAHYPKVKTFNHTVNIAEQGVKKAKLSWYDLLTYSFSYSPSNATTIVSPTLSGMQFGLFFNIGNLLLKPHNIKQAKSELEIARLNKQEYNLAIEAEVKARYFKYIQQLAVLKLQREMLLDIETLYKQAKYRFEKGEEILENYSKTIVQLNSQKQNILSAEGYVLIAKSSLEEIICKPFEDIR
jgi:outer membrane protein TolC